MATEPGAGTVLDERYRLEQQLGAGGMGTVWEATHLGLGRRVAVKLLHPKYARDGELLVRFRREAEAAARLSHPHIVDVSDFATAPSGPAYMVMELLRGESLRARIEREAPLPIDAVATIADQALDALTAAHAAGVVHRDLKPDNIFLAESPEGGCSVKLLDFGLARLEGIGGLTKTGTTVGTPLYMPPEQVRGSKVDARADLWALAASLYEALTGRPPFEASAYGELVAKIVSAAAAPLATRRPDAPPGLVRAIEAALVKDPDGRVQSATAMRGMLDDAAARADEAARRAALAPTIQPSPRFAVPVKRKHATPGKQQIAFMVTPESFRPPPPSSSVQAASTPRPATRGGGSRASLWLGLSAAVLLLAGAGGATWWAVSLDDGTPIEGGPLPPAAPPPSGPPPAEPAPVAPVAVHPATPPSPGPPDEVPDPERATGGREGPVARSPRPARNTPADDAPAPRSPFASSAELVGVSGDYDRWAAESHLGTAQSRFVRCVREATVPPGRATFTVTLEPNGSVSSVGGSPEDARQCLWRAMQGVPWMPPPGGVRANVQATYRFVAE